MSISKLDRAYIAGFLDADGSIYVQLKPNKTYKYKFQVAVNIAFYQSAKEKRFMYNLLNLIGKGYIRERKDKIIEYIIGDENSIVDFLEKIKPFLKLKKKQANLMLDILKTKKSVKSVKDFLRLAKKIDLFRNLNYSKTRKNDYHFVRKVLVREGLLTP